MSGKVIFEYHELLRAAARRAAASLKGRSGVECAPREVEPDVKTSQRREGFDCAGTRMRVTDRADVTVRVAEHLHELPGAGQVFGKQRPWQVTLAVAAQQTEETRGTSSVRCHE